MANYKRSELNKALDQCPEIVQLAVWGPYGYRAQIEKLDAQVVELEQERDELVAHVERLRDVVIEYHDENIACKEALNELWEIHSKTPPQNLNAVKREVAMQAIRIAAREFGRPNITEAAVQMLAHDYANTKYPNGKE